jgi:hypothetical protein
MCTRNLALSQGGETDYLEAEGGLGLVFKRLSYLLPAILILFIFLSAELVLEVRHYLKGYGNIFCVLEWSVRLFWRH